MAIELAAELFLVGEPVPCRRMVTEDHDDLTFAGHGKKKLNQLALTDAKFALILVIEA